MQTFEKLLSTAETFGSTHFLNVLMTEISDFYIRNFLHNHERLIGNNLRRTKSFRFFQKRLIREHTVAT